MIGDILEHAPGARLHAEVIVIGSGIAGAELALHLSRHGRDVLMLESGRHDFDPAIQALNDVRFTGKPHRLMDPDAGYHAYLPPELRGVSRVRQFGGTSTIWTGKWKMFQPGDFAPRSWVPDSGWPFGFDELIGYYRDVARDYGFAEIEAAAARPGLAAFQAALAPAGLKAASFYWEAEPTRTAVRFGDEMRRARNLRVVLGATATELVLDDTRRRVAEVRCGSLEGRRLSARADTIVLAAGGFETPRLLLASDRDRPGGIGNGHDLVGRFYADHFKHHTGALVPGPLTRRFAGELQYTPKPRSCLCFALDDATQRRHELLEHAVFLKPVYEGRRARIARLLRGRPVCRDGQGSVAVYGVKFASEQVPNRDSRVMLGTRTDPLGMRELVVDWRTTEQDRQSIETTLDLLTRRFAAAGIGTFDFGDAPPALETMTDAAHQIGTTRMAAGPDRGVVDPDCRVFGTENLYVAGSAVFPTVPSYSPTLTILAMARRLGEHLLGRQPDLAVRAASEREPEWR